MPDLKALHNDDLAGLRRQTEERYTAFCAQALRLDMTRGKPSPEQLDLCNAMLELPGKLAYTAADKTDCRNYGGLQGLPEARALFAEMMGAPAEQVLVGNNSSLALMHDTMLYALLSGVPDGSGAWSAQAPISFLCPTPGYDRHFTICEGYNIRMISVPLTGHGPDMDLVERLVAEDASIKGMWCVPKYNNPTGEIYSDQTVERLAAMRTAAPDFRLFWDNAYGVHHLTATRHEIANILEACTRHGNPNRAIVFGSTSKITFAGAGVALLATSKANLTWFSKQITRRTIGPDKLNQLRHVQLLRDQNGIAALMDRHRAILAPKFESVLKVFADLLGGSGAASWTKPQGGYFISLDVPDGCAKRVVELAKAAGIALTPAGSTFPYGKDPNDRNLRIAPSYPPAKEVTLAAEGIAISVLLAATEALLTERKTGEVNAVSR